jgi:serine/threonine-protein kinase
MGAARTCPQCHATLPDDAPDGPCPRCSYGVVMGASSTEETADAAAPIGAPATVMRTPQAPARLGHDETTLDVPPGKFGPTPASFDTPARYELGDEVARGGMGAVLRARDAALGRELAVKVLLDRHRGRPEVLRRFVEEARIGGQLQHPGVVPVYDLGTLPDARPFFAMKLVEGRTLAALLAERADPSADLPRFLSIFEAVCQAVAYAHARGVIHRDLKPSNIMVGAFGEVQVMDWGLAKVLSDGAEAEEAERALRAARLAGRDESMAGDVLGTPAYMAPEQARGEVERVGRRADVFGLGGILASILTGGPTFRASNASAALDLARAGDTADVLARLEACGADSELVALARDCLSAEPEGRPADAGLVAARMTAYLAGVQERLRRAELARVEAQARAEEEAKRAAVERQRRRLTMGLAASLLALTTLGGLAFTYARQQAQARAARVDRLLAEARLLRDQARERPEDVARWERAQESVDRVAQEIGPSSVPLAELRRDVEAGQAAAESDRDLLARLVDIRSAEADEPDGSATDAAYAHAFADAGIDLDGGDPAEAGAKVARRPAPVAAAMVAALDDAAGHNATGARGRGWARLLAVARAADPDPDRDALRAALLVADRAEGLSRLRPLAGRADAGSWAPASLVLLGDALAGAGDLEAGIAVLRRASWAHPEDARAHFALGVLLRFARPPQPEEAIRAYSLAWGRQPELAGHALAHALEERGRGAEAEAVWRDLVGRRPDNGRHLGGYGRHLKDRGRGAEAAPLLDRAVAALREAVRLRPDLPADHNNLGLALVATGDLPGAIAAFREAIRLRPDDAMYHNNLGLALVATGDLPGAVAACREAVRLKPDLAEAHCNLGNALHMSDDLPGAVAALREAIGLRPDLAAAHVNLGNALRGSGDSPGAVAAYREAVRMRPDDAEARSGLGIALAESNDLPGAIAALREAVRLRPDYAQAHGNLGAALAESNDLPGAIAALREAIRLQPDLAEAHCTLGAALRQQGRYSESLAEFRLGHEFGSKRAAWRHPSAAWVAQAERLAALAERLPAVLGGSAEPADNAERLAFAQMAYDAKRYAGAARLWSQALEADPKLAADRQAQHRYNAACAAALAASGQGVDDPPLDEATKVKLRAQALGWLRSELAAWSKLVESGPPQARAFVAQTLEHWEKDADLAGVRGPDALGKLPEAERDAWRALWGEVGRLLARARDAGSR